jgi:hypothetical protein
MSDTTDGRVAPIAELFPADDVRARFVVLMSMARNALDVTPRDPSRRGHA